MANSKKELILDGLDCANCAAKIERKVNDIDGVNIASLNFMTKTLVIEINDGVDTGEIVLKTRDIVKTHEPDVEVIEKEKYSAEKKSSGINMDILRIITGSVIFAIPMILTMPDLVKVIFFALSYFIIGYDVIRDAAKGISNKDIFNENFLMTIATAGAFAIKEYPEAVAVMLFFQIGEFFQKIAVERSKQSIDSLLNIRPDYANLMVNDQIKKVSPEMVKPGSYIVVKPGEKIPLDGIIEKGSSSLDTSAITGEFMPREMHESDEVFAGYINKNGLLTIKTTKSFEQSTVSKIIEMVQNASGKKAQLEKFITKFARYYTPVVIFSALALAVIPPVILSQSFTVWLSRALIFLVVSCPCALVLSIPLAFFSGIGVSSRKGILVKGGNFLEGLNKVDTVVFDKTGTLTKGNLLVDKIIPSEGYTESQLLKYATIAESNSSHPIAQSVVSKFKERNKIFMFRKIEKYEEISGHGMKVEYEGDTILAGNEKLLKKFNISYNKDLSDTTSIYIAVNGNFAGIITFKDEVKEEAAVTIKLLKETDKKVFMLTGDKKESALSIAAELGIDKENVFYELLPENKLEKVEELQKNKKNNSNIVFVGDGINDSPVIARADIGVAMGKIGSDAAIEAADIVIMNDNPSKLLEAMGIASKTRIIAMQNVIFALGIKLLVMGLGAFGIATMWEAVFADVGVALIAVLNSMRILKK